MGYSKETAAAIAVDNSGHGNLQNARDNVAARQLSIDRLIAEVDHEKKIDTWCFGHYHSDIEQQLDGIRYLNNCRGRGGTEWCKPVYYPKRIEIEF